MNFKDYLNYILKGLYPFLVAFISFFVGVKYSLLTFEFFPGNFLDPIKTYEKDKGRPFDSTQFIISNKKETPADPSVHNGLKLPNANIPAENSIVPGEEGEVKKIETPVSEMQNNQMANQSNSPTDIQQATDQQNSALNQAQPQVNQIAQNAAQQQLQLVNPVAPVSNSQTQSVGDSSSNQANVASGNLNNSPKLNLLPNGNIMNSASINNNPSLNKPNMPTTNSIAAQQPSVGQNVIPPAVNQSVAINQPTLNNLTPPNKPSVAINPVGLNNSNNINGGSVNPPILTSPSMPAMPSVQAPLAGQLAPAIQAPVMPPVAQRQPSIQGNLNLNSQQINQKSSDDSKVANGEIQPDENLKKTPKRKRKYKNKNLAN